MGRSQDREVKNMMARSGFFVLFAAYLTGAVISSLPIEKNQHSAAISAQSIVVSSAEYDRTSHVGHSFKSSYAAPQNKALKKAGDEKGSNPAQWWQRHARQAMLLQGKWWRQHKVALVQSVIKEPKSVEKRAIMVSKKQQKTESPDQRMLLAEKRRVTPSFEPALKIHQPTENFVMARPADVRGAFAKTRVSDLYSLGQSIGELQTSPSGESLRARLVGLDLTKSLPLIHRAVVAYGSKRTEFLDKNKPDLPSDVSKNSLPKAQRPHIPAQMPPSHVSKSKLPEGNKAPLTKKASLKEKIRLKKDKTTQCSADKVAGWSSLKLLEKHKELLRQSSAVSGDVSALLAALLKAKGFEAGTPVYMRIFKDRSLLEVWLEKDGRYALFHTYKICRWSGSFGPKLYEGDRQSPEGFYLVDDQLFNRHSWKWKGSFSIGYPNAYDKLHGRTGSLILVHGGCTSSGCFALTNPVIKEVHELAQLARDHGQQKFAIHVFPFKLTQANLKRHKNSPWSGFWDNLKEGYDLFEKNRTLPVVSVCNKRYVFALNGQQEAGAGGKNCYGLQAFIPGWRPARRVARIRRRGRRVYRGRSLGSRLSCNYNRPSCRKFIALKNRKRLKRRSVRKKVRVKSRRRRVARRPVSKRRRAFLRGARAIGRKRKPGGRRTRK